MRCAEMVCFLLVCTCLVCVDAAPKLAVPDWFNHKTLGVGVHASPQLKHAAAKALKNFRSLIREKVIVNQVSASVRRFLEAVTARDCEGWVRHTDDFCIKVAARDAATLREYEIPGDLNL